MKRLTALTVFLLVGCSPPEREFTVEERRDFLEHKYEYWKASQPLLKQVKVISTRYEDRDFYAVFENGTDHVLHGISCEYRFLDREGNVVSIGGRDLHFSLHGEGIEPGERKELVSYPNVPPGAPGNQELLLTPVLLLSGEKVIANNWMMTEAERDELMRLREDMQAGAD